MRRRLMLRNASGGGGSLPSEYQQVEWIGCSGGQYVNTLLKYSGTICTIRSTVIFNSTGDMKFLGNYTAGVACNNGYFRLSSGSLYGQEQIAASVNTEYKITLTKGSKIVLDVNGSTAERNGEASRSENIGIGCMFLNTTAYSGFNGKFVGNTEIEIDGAIAGNFVPCYRIADVEIGLYDTVSNAFFTNAGSGSFTKGADV